MKLEPKTNCPLNAFKPCKELECAWFLKVSGKNPQKDEEIEEWGCAVAWLPILSIENARVSFQTGAAVESFRNEMVKSNENYQEVLSLTLQQNSSNLKLIEGVV